MTGSPHSVLVTHSESPIGERLVKELLRMDSVEHVLAVGSAPRERVLPFAWPRRLQYLQVDLRRTRHIHRLLFGQARALGVDTLIHTTHHHSPYQSGRRLHALNVRSTRELLEMSERHPTIERFVYRSGAEVYQIQADLPVLIEEDHPLNLGRGAPQWIRDRVQADLAACTRMGLSPLHIVVLRFAECLAPGTGSQLYDYLESPVCFRPPGYNPMINVITIADTIQALVKAIRCEGQGVFNVPGRDTLPLNRAILEWGRVALPLPDNLITTIYRLRGRITGHEFRYGMNRRRFHYSGILDGTRARRELDYTPCHPVEWPVSLES